MIEIVDGIPLTRETSSLANLYHKLMKESKTYSPLLDQLLKSCEKFKSNLRVLSLSLTEILVVLERLSKACLKEGSSGLTLDIGDFLSGMTLKQFELVESLDIFDEQFSDIIKNVKERKVIHREAKTTMKKKHSKNILSKRADIKKSNFNITKIERDNKEKEKFVDKQKEKDFQVANILLDCKDLESREKLALLQMAKLERTLFTEYLISFKKVLLLQRELFAASNASDSINKLDELLLKDSVSVEAGSEIISVSKNPPRKIETEDTIETESGGHESSTSSQTDRTSLLSHSSSELSVLSGSRPGARFSTVRRSPSPMRSPEYVARPVACRPPVIPTPSPAGTSYIQKQNTFHTCHTEDVDNEVSFYMENLSALDGNYYCFDSIKTESI